MVYNTNMIDLKILKENPRIIREAIEKRGADVDLDAIIDLDNQRRLVIARLQNANRERNKVSEEIAALKAQAKDVRAPMERARLVASQIKDLEHEQKEIPRISPGGQR
jgi:seryl-tRNA synthetase